MSVIVITQLVIHQSASYFQNSIHSCTLIICYNTLQDTIILWPHFDPDGPILTYSKKFRQMSVIVITQLVIHQSASHFQNSIHSCTLIICYNTLQDTIILWPHFDPDGPIFTYSKKFRQMSVIVITQLVIHQFCFKFSE